MKKFIKISAIILGALLVIAVILSLIGDKKYEVSRSILINSDRESVWKQVAFWENHKNWSPWVAKDTAMEIKIDGKDGEVGSTYRWKSETQGSGRQTIIEIKPMETRVSDLFFENWGGGAVTSFNLKDSAGSVLVTWKMYGENGFFGRIMSAFFNLDKMIGADYEAGLKNIKELCEKGGSNNYKIGEPGEKEFVERTFIALRKKYSMDSFLANAGQIFGDGAGKLMSYLEQNGIKMTGTLYGLFYLWDENSKVVDMAVAVPVEKTMRVGNGLEYLTVPRTKCVSVDFWGDYSKTEAAHIAIENWLKENNKTSGYPAMEEYVTDPTTEKNPMKVLTRIWYPLK